MPSEKEIARLTDLADQLSSAGIEPKHVLPSAAPLLDSAEQLRKAADARGYGPAARKAIADAVSEAVEKVIR